MKVFQKNVKKHYRITQILCYYILCFNVAITSKTLIINKLPFLSKTLIQDENNNWQVMIIIQTVVVDKG